MHGKATHSKARCTARKARLLRNLIIGKLATHAIALLAVENRAGSTDIIKLIRSALAQIPQYSPDSIIISEFIVNEGPRRKMFMPRAQGRATPILKKTSHLTICLSIN